MTWLADFGPGWLRELTRTEGAWDGQTEELEPGADRRDAAADRGANRTRQEHCSKEAEISEQSYFRWRKEYGGVAVEQAKRLKDLERENARLRRLVADLSLEKQILKDVASGNL
jgi:putative transposase